MPLNCVLQVRGLGWLAMLVAVGVGVGCEGVIGDGGVGPAVGAVDAGVTMMPPGAPGELDGSGGSSGGSGGAVVAPGTGGRSMGDGSGGAPQAGAGEPIHGLTITDVAIYQAVKVALAKSGQPVTALAAPVVSNRPALVRVFMAPSEGWLARTVVGRLNWGVGMPPKEVSAVVAGNSVDATLGSTLNFQLAASDLKPDVEWSLSLFEAPGGTGVGSTTGSVMPADGSKVKLTTIDSGAALKVTLVPIRNNNSLPDTSPAQLKFLNDAMFATYPVAKVEFTVHEPMDFPTRIQAQGPGWDAALNQVCMLRQSDRPAHNVFYYGLVTPGPFETYCEQGCVEGIAVLAQNPTQDLTRCAMGIGYTNLGGGVFLQEVAHAMGRSHAPCGNPAQPDRMYPYAMGRIGSWGYDLVRQRLVDPARNADFMSYCSPVWISDYTFAKLLPWIKTVNGLSPSMLVSGTATTPEFAPAWLPPQTSSSFAAITDQGALPFAPARRFAPARWRMATVESDGSVLWGQLVNLDELSGGEVHTVAVRDAQGQQSTVEGMLFPHSNTGGGMLLLPESVPRAHGVQFGRLGAFRNVRVE